MWRFRLQEKYANLACIVLLSFAAGALTLWHLRAPTRILQDDGYYYLQIARNLAHGMGSTFDGVNPTNGYQPLWQIMLVPIFWIVRSNLDALRVGIAIQGIAFTCTLIVIFHSARLRYGRAASLFGALLWLVWMAQESFKGMEFSIHALSIAVIGFLYLKWFAVTLPTELAPFLWLGIACSVAFLARLETLALGFILGFSLLLEDAKQKKFFWRNWFAFALPLLLAALGYGLINFFFVWAFCAGKRGCQSNMVTRVGCDESVV